jgi:D-alanyl-D-alanine carboxypeptidase (penicillin-binding protein 5/6)
MVLFEQNADGAIPPASITKILTLYLVYEAMERGELGPNDLVKVSVRAARTGGSRMFLKAGSTVTVEQLIKGMAIFSGNDACVAIAEHISGSVPRFVARMNLKARQLGMSRSYFLNPNGLPAKGQVTTARDIAKLSLAYLRRFPESLSVHSMQSYTYNKVTQSNRNRLLGKCYGVDGIKTGWICASGYHVSATARRQGTRLIAVVLGARSPGIRTVESYKLLEAGFTQLGLPSPAPLEVKTAALHSSDEGSSCEVTPKSKNLGKSSVRKAKGRSTGRSASVRGTSRKAAASQTSKPASTARRSVQETARTKTVGKSQAISGGSTKSRVTSKPVSTKGKGLTSNKNSAKGTAPQPCSPTKQDSAPPAKAVAKPTTSAKSSARSQATP